MGNPVGFLEHGRELPPRRRVELRVLDWNEVYDSLPLPRVRDQSARCMDCGVPFCHLGCPLANLIPDWNDLVYRGRWREASDRLHATNNFPEFTGRLCPAPCEASCVLAINSEAVTIKQVEVQIIDRAWAEGWVLPEPPRKLTGKRVSIIGSGPAGLACAQQLRRAGHEVSVFERADRIGGLLRYGIPHFRLEKRLLDRRLEQLEAEGVCFYPSIEVGVDVDARALRRSCDALVLTGGATQPRDLAIPGRGLKGIYQAMEFLPMANRYATRDYLEREGEILLRATPPFALPPKLIPYVTARGRRVIIIGGGDTGADCLGTVHRQGCLEVRQFQIHPRPPDTRAPDNPWPQWGHVFRTSSAHLEGGRREFSLLTLEFLGDEQGHVRALRTVRVREEHRDGRTCFGPLEGAEEVYAADLVLLALGFTGAEPSPLLTQLGVELDARGNVNTDENRMTGAPGVFAAGDMTRGASLLVWAIAEGRHAAHGVDHYLMGSSDLPRPLEFGNDQAPFQ